MLGAPIDFVSGVVVGVCSEIADKGTFKDDVNNTQAEALSLEDVQKLSKAGVDDTIIKN